MDRPANYKAARYKTFQSAAAQTVTGFLAPTNISGNEPLSAISDYAGMMSLERKPLSREEEGVLARRMESAREGILTGLLSNTATIKAIESIYRNIFEGKVLPHKYIYLKNNNATNIKSEEDRPEEPKSDLKDAFVQMAEKCSDLCQAQKKGSSDIASKREQLVVDIVKTLRLKDARLVAIAENFGELARLGHVVLKVALAAGIKREEFAASFVGQALTGTWPELLLSKGVSRETVLAFKEQLAAIEEQAGLPLLHYEKLIIVTQKHQRELLKVKEQMVRANLGLVLSIAKKFRNKGLPFADLAQVGNMALMRVVESFDFRLGNKLSSFATPSIHNSMIRALDEVDGDVNIPIDMRKTLRKLHQIHTTFFTQHGRHPTVSEVAAVSKLPTDEVMRLSVTRISTISLDAPARHDADETVGSLIEDTSSKSSFDQVAEIQLQAQVAAALATLPEKKERILRMYFGIGKSTTHTFKDIGKEFKITREGVRQNAYRAIDELSRRAKELHLHQLFEDPKEKAHAAATKELLDTKNRRLNRKTEETQQRQDVTQRVTRRKARQEQTLVS